MLVTFLVFAGFSLIILVMVLWYLWPSSRVSTSVPGASPSHQQLGNLPNIRDAGGLPRYLVELHQKHGMLVSFWIQDFLVITTGAQNLFKLSGNVKPEPYESIVPLTTHDNILLKTNSAEKFLNACISGFSPSCVSWSQFCPDSVDKLLEELVSVLKGVGEEDQIPINDYITALVIKIVAVRRNLDVEKVRTAFTILQVDLDLFFEDAEEFSEERMKLLFDKAEQFEKVLGSIQNKHEVYGEILCLSMLATWSLYYLSKYENLQDLLLGNESATQNFMSEVLRISALLPFTSKIVNKDVTMVGHVIEQGTLVINSFVSVFNDCSIFPEPTNFDIDRPNVSTVIQCYHPDLIESSTLKITELIILKFVQNFKMTLADPHLKVSQKFSLVNKPDCDIWLKFMKK